jgi:hypothetical protein
VTTITRTLPVKSSEWSQKRWPECLTKWWFTQTSALISAVGLFQSGRRILLLHGATIDDGLASS